MFLFNLTVTLVIVFTTWLYIKWYKMKTFWIRKGIAQCDVHPIFGSYHIKETFMQRINPAVWMENVYKQYERPYVGFWVFWRPGLIVNCPKLVHNICVKDADNFRNRLLGTGTRDKLGTLNMFTVNDPLWTTVRKRLTSVFTSAKLRNWSDLFRSKSADLVVRIKSDNQKGIRNNLKTLFADYSTDTIGESAFGIKCEATKTSVGPLRAMTKEFEKYSVYRGLEWCTIFFFPELADLFGFTFWPKNTNVYFKEVFHMISKQRGGYERETEGKKDLMDALVKMKQELLKDNKDIDEIVLIANAMIFLQAGYETSSTVMAYITYELAYKMEYQEKLYQELIEAKDKIGDREFESNDLAELPYLNAVIKEVLRKYPIMGWLDRVATKDYQVDEHLTIPAGTVVYLNTNGIHLDPKLYPEPSEIKPERFLPENAQNIPSSVNLPFGDGPRACIGKLFAMISLRYALASISTNFILKPLPNMPLPNDVPIQNKGLFYSPGQTLHVDFVPRN